MPNPSRQEKRNLFNKICRPTSDNFWKKSSVETKKLGGTKSSQKENFPLLKLYNQMHKQKMMKMENIYYP